MRQKINRTSDPDHVAERGQSAQEGEKNVVFSDNRLSAIAQRDIRQTTENGSRQQQQAAIINMIDNSPRTTAQRKKAVDFFGNNAVQLKTKITHYSGTASFNGASGPVGLKMIAQLDPSDPVRGSTPDAKNDGASADLYKRVAKARPDGDYARGHLLNHDLGGYGVNENLYPITRGANARHSLLVEQNVKARLQEVKEQNDENENEDREDDDLEPDRLGVQYSVKVLGTPEHAQFACEWKSISLGGLEIGSEAEQAGSELIGSNLENKEDRFFQAGHSVGLGEWSHKNSNATGKKKIKKERKGAEDIEKEKKKKHIVLSAGTAGTLRPEEEESKPTEEHMEKIRAYWAKHPATLSAEEQEISDKHQEKLAKIVEDEKKLLATTGRTLRERKPKTE